MKYAEMPAATHNNKTQVSTFFGPRRSVGFAIASAPISAENCTIRKRMITPWVVKPNVTPAITPAIAMMVSTPSM